jgi:hypothetical protein
MRSNCAPSCGSSRWVGLFKAVGGIIAPRRGRAEPSSFFAYLSLPLWVFCRG